MNEKLRFVETNNHPKAEKSNKDKGKTIQTPKMNGSDNPSELKSVFPIEAPIFALNIDCFEEIFDYLSLKDVHSFGQTCKALQKV